MNEKKFRKILIIVLIQIVFSFNIFANQDPHNSKTNIYQIYVIVFSSLGTGLSLSYKFKENLWLNYTKQSLSGTMSIDSKDRLNREEADYEFHTQFLNFRNYLTYFIKNMFFQYGVIHRRWDTKTVIKSNKNSQNQAIYSTNYPANGINFGVGMNWTLEHAIIIELSLVSLISKDPEFNYEIEEEWECSELCRSDYENNIKKYSPKNSIYLNLGYTF